MNGRIQNPLRIAKMLHIAYISGVFIMGIVSYVLSSRSDFEPIFVEEATLSLITITLAVIGIMQIIVAFFISRWLLKFNKKTQNSQQELLSVHILRCALIEAIAIYGFVLKMLGSDWAVTIAFMSAALILFVLTFPNEKKWSKHLVG